MMRAVLWAAVAISLLGACASDVVRSDSATKPETGKPDTGLWTFERRNDPISGKEVATASVVISRLTLLSGVLRAGELQLICFKSQPVIRIRLDRKVGTARTSALAYRFDTHEGRYADAIFFSRDGLIVIDNKDEVAQFTGQLQSAQTLYLRITRLRGSTLTAEFPVRGASHAIEAAYAECPVKEKRRTQTSMLRSRHLTF
jgi:hypothetical protein